MLEKYKKIILIKFIIAIFSALNFDRSDLTCHKINLIRILQSITLDLNKRIETINLENLV